MISGIFFRHNSRAADNSLLQRLVSKADIDTRIYHDKLLLTRGTADSAVGMTANHPVSLDNDRLVGCWTGKIYNRDALAADVAPAETIGT